jgi:hypothetical protein
MCTLLITRFKTFETPRVKSAAADHIFAIAIMEKKNVGTICSDDVSTIINTNINEHTWSPDKQSYNSWTDKKKKSQNVP